MPYTIALSLCPISLGALHDTNSAHHDKNHHEGMILIVAPAVSALDIGDLMLTPIDAVATFIGPLLFQKILYLW